MPFASEPMPIRTLGEDGGMIRVQEGFGVSPMSLGAVSKLLLTVYRVTFDSSVKTQRKAPVIEEVIIHYWPEVALLCVKLFCEAIIV